MHTKVIQFYRHSSNIINFTLKSIFVGFHNSDEQILNYHTYNCVAKVYALLSNNNFSILEKISLKAYWSIVCQLIDI